MSERVSNLRAGNGVWNVLLLATAAMSMLGLVGVVASPAGQLSDVRALYDVVRREAARSGDLDSALTGFRQGGGYDRLELARARVGRQVPSRLSPVEVHSLFRLLADGAGVELEAVELGATTEAPFEQLDDRVMALRVVLKGSTNPDGLVQLVRTLEETGYPAAVRGFSLVRGEPHEEAFEFHLALAMYHTAPRVAGASDSNFDEDAP